MKMYLKPLTKDELSKYLAIKDLTTDSRHAIGLLCQKIIAEMKKIHPNTDVRLVEYHPIVSTKDNYDDLLIDKDNISRSSTYTHYVDEDHILRTHTSAHMPAILRELAQDSSWDDVLILLPGLAYRRDVTDKKHVGQVHMLEMWRIVKNSQKVITKEDLLGAVKAVASVAAPGWGLRIENSPHPYTSEGIEVNAVKEDSDIEILECGLINQQILKDAGLDTQKHSGWALGMGLDRLVMTIKQIPDIRYLRSINPEIAKQMTNLDKYHEVSSQPAIERDMSYSVPVNYVEEDIHEDIRVALGSDLDLLESIEILSETKYHDLPDSAKQKLGIKHHQKNVLVRITLRSLEKSITNNYANKVYDQVYSKVNYGESGYSA